MSQQRQDFGRCQPHRSVLETSTGLQDHHHLLFFLASFLFNNGHKHRAHAVNQRESLELSPRSPTETDLSRNLTESSWFTLLRIPHVLPSQQLTHFRSEFAGHAKPLDTRQPAGRGLTPANVVTVPVLDRPRLLFPRSPHNLPRFGSTNPENERPLAFSILVSIRISPQPYIHHRLRGVLIASGTVFLCLQPRSKALRLGLRCGVVTDALDTSSVVVMPKLRCTGLQYYTSEATCFSSLQVV